MNSVLEKQRFVMAKKKTVLPDVEDGEFKEWHEGESIDTFQLNRIADHYTPLMQEWLIIDLPTF